ncbi:MAG: hypothetical protein LUG99_09445 [Lachnospiraceae bacterium]|nr:hypothetical protein [Lachnospiraceae bacterium]
MEMEKQQEKLAGQIQKAEEQLKKLREKDTDLKKRIREKREKEQAAWTAKFDKLLQPFIERKYGADYFEKILPEEAAGYFSCIEDLSVQGSGEQGSGELGSGELGGKEQGGGDRNGYPGGYEDH